MDKIKYHNESILSQGYGIIPKKIMRDKNISIEAKAIYSYICSFAGAGNSAFPSAKLIIYDLNIGENRFYKYRKELIDSGYITIEKQRKKNRRDNNIYILEQIIEHSHFECIQNERIQNEHIQNKGTNINNTNINNTNINNTNKNISSSEEIEEDIVTNIKSKIKERGYSLKKKEILTLVELYGITKTFKAIEASLSVNSDIGNFYGYVNSVLKEMETQKVVNIQTEKPKDNFNNFKQREYDFDSLERKLLGWDKE